MKRAPLLQLQEISFGYTEDRLALHNISVDIFPGQRIALLGNNGAGKSTFFLCCTGVLHPQHGQLLLNGNRLTRKKQDLMRLREAVGLVFQDPDDQIVASTVAAEISFGPLNLGLGREQAEQRVEHALQAMHLREHRARPPHYLSGGEKKRVTIADILAMHPQMILFDEPTASLDPQNTARLVSILADLSDRGMTLMVATHDIDFVYTWADRALVFHGGTLLADAAPCDVFSNNALLRQAGLQKPTLYATAELICRERGIPPPRELPKTKEEFLLFMKELGL